MTGHQGLMKEHVSTEPAERPALHPARPLVLGIGNVLMGDEGVGVHAIRLLETQQLPPPVAVIDGGTGGFHLLSFFEDYDPIIIIDATMDGRRAGTVLVTQPRFASDFPRTLSAHDIGLRDLLESASLLGQLPRLYLITVSVENLQAMHMELSRPVREALGEVALCVKEIVEAELEGAPRATDPEKESDIHG